MSDDEKQVDENGAIEDREEREQYYNDADDMGTELIALNAKLKPHGHSVASLLREFANRMHGIRI